MSRAERLQAARRALAQQQASARARLQAARQRPAVPGPLAERRRARRRRRVAVGLGLLLLLLLLRACPDPPPEADPPPRAPTGPAALGSAPAPSTDGPTPPALDRQPRPAYAADAPRPPTWTDALQLQVTARSTRLSACFEGAATPGLLEWAVTVDPRLGTTSGATLTPLRPADTVRPADRDCALDVLAQPPYRLGAPTEPPAQVRLVLEF